MRRGASHKSIKWMTTGQCLTHLNNNTVPLTRISKQGLLYRSPRRVALATMSVITKQTETNTHEVAVKPRGLTSPPPHAQVLACCATGYS